MLPEGVDFDVAIDVAKWYEKLSETSNKAFMPLYFDEHRFLVLKGGGGSGKSVFAARKVVERCATEPKSKFLVVRKVANTLKDSCFALILSTLEEHYKDIGYKVNMTDKTITFKNRSQILFKGLDNVEKLKSIVGITSIWVEEASEITEFDFNQINIRLRDRCVNYKQIILSFNPISSQHWLKRRFFDRIDADAITSETTYKDNRFLPDDAIKVLEDFKNTDEYYYTVYCLGQWGVLGKTVFNAREVAARLDEHIKPINVGRFGLKLSDAEKVVSSWFIEDQSGECKVYEEPQTGVPYVIGADTAGDGSDFSVAQVLDNRTGKQVCVLRAQSMDEDVFTRQVYCLGKWYNEALIAGECNFSSFFCLELQRMGYGKQYVRETLDDYTLKPKKAFGFRTDLKTRPIIIAGLIRAMRDDIKLVADSATLEEMLTFVRNESYRPEAEQGAHDDCVMSLAIAHFVRPHQDYNAMTKEDIYRKRIVWDDSMWEDYYKADEDERAYLLAKWGTPEELR